MYQHYNFAFINYFLQFVIQLQIYCCLQTLVSENNLHWMRKCPKLETYFN